MPMVQYWKYRSAVFGNNRKQKEGHQALFLEGEKHPLVGIPRSHMLFGKLSKMKHEIKNQIFNESWAMIEYGNSTGQIVHNTVGKIPGIYAIYQEMKLDVVPPEVMIPAVKEIYRAWTKAAPGRTSYMLRDML